jgi:hypothetical protein
MTPVKPIIAILSAAFLLYGCAVDRPVQRDVDDGAEVKEIEEPVESSYAIEPITEGFLSFFYIPHPEADFGKLMNVFTDYPDFRVTLIFPPNYFKREIPEEYLVELKLLAKKNQIEVGMHLDNEPPLPLLGDLSLASHNVPGWEFSFEWPDDISSQMAKGSGIFQKRWEKHPGGFLPPYFALSQEVIDALGRFRLSWVLAQPDPEHGVVYEDGLVILVPPILEWNEELVEGTKNWAKQFSGHIMTQGFALVDGTLWENPKTEGVFLETLAEKTTWDNPNLHLILGEELTRVSLEEFELPREVNFYTEDFSRWVRTDRQRLAWQALSEARAVVERYKNSGKANIKRLDAAMEEIYLAESGTFLLALGQTQVPLTNSERAFLATLANVYRLCGETPPPNLNTWFAYGGKIQSTELGIGRDVPFFVEGVQKLTWNDSKGDDFGDGQYIYPMGSYPKGAFDLKSFSVSWARSDIIFQTEFFALPSKEKNVVLPVVDIYLDVNRYAGAGSMDPLEDRNSIRINKNAAWEYAIAMDPNSGAIFQSIPGQNPRQIKELAVEVNLEDHSLRVEVPRELLRGIPPDWRMSVGVAGVDGKNRSAAFVPVPVYVNPGERNFGGSASTHQAPPFIDILADTPKAQQKAMGAYRRGGKAPLPFVEAQ